jgi:hypothetical protein
MECVFLKYLKQALKALEVPPRAHFLEWQGKGRYGGTDVKAIEGVLGDAPNKRIITTFPFLPVSL